MIRIAISDHITVLQTMSIGSDFVIVRVDSTGLNSQDSGKLLSPLSAVSEFNRRAVQAGCQLEGVVGFSGDVIAGVVD